MWYSVEAVPKDDEHNCWDQYGLTENKWSARWSRLELRMSLWRTHKTRVREVG